MFLIIVCEEATSKCKLDKDLATEIQTKIKEDEDLKDETAGWHVITGKSFASAITYKTTCVLFFDLLDGHHKWLGSGKVIKICELQNIVNDIT